jgi:hypothetical protein
MGKNCSLTLIKYKLIHSYLSLHKNQKKELIEKEFRTNNFKAHKFTQKKELTINNLKRGRVHKKKECHLIIEDLFFIMTFHIVIDR